MNDDEINDIDYATYEKRKIGETHNIKKCFQLIHSTIKSGLEKRKLEEIADLIEILKSYNIIRQFIQSDVTDF